MNTNLTLLNLLDAYIPSPAEIDAKEQIQEFLKTHDRPFHRETLDGHITGSALLLNQDCTHFLIMHHTKLDKWLQPGGHSDGDPDVLAVAIREAQEESGIQHIIPVTSDIFDLDVHEILGGSVPGHIHYDVRFLLKTVDTDSFVQNSESQALRWIPLHAPMPIPLDTSLLRMIHKAQAYYPAKSK